MNSEIVTSVAVVDLLSKAKAEKYAFMLQCAQEGKTYTEVGMLLGISRNAVAGYANRNNIKFGRRKEVVLPKGKILEERIKKIVDKRKERIERIINERKDYKGPVRLQDADRYHCRWPEGYEKAGVPLCCGRVVVDGSPYCELHRTMTIKRKVPTDT